MEKLTINGSVMTVAKLIIAVKEIESAVSPFDNFVIIFDVTQPGQQAKIIIPTAISFVMPIKDIMINATSGKIII